MPLMLNDFHLARIVSVQPDFEGGKGIVFGIPQGNDVGFPQEARGGIASNTVLHSLPFFSERMRSSKRYCLNGWTQWHSLGKEKGPFI